MSIALAPAANATAEKTSENISSTIKDDFKNYDIPSLDAKKVDEIESKACYLNNLPDTISESRQVVK
jgi:hypothetical protein